MARNAKLDLAKRQSVGIERPIQRFAVGTARAPEIISKRLLDHAGNSVPPVLPIGMADRRSLEAEKACFNQGKPQPVDVTGLKVTICNPGTAKGVGGLNRKTSRATPTSRGHMGTFAYRQRQAPAAIVRNAWRGVVQQTLIPVTPR